MMFNFFFFVVIHGWVVYLDMKMCESKSFGDNFFLGVMEG